MVLAGEGGSFVWTKVGLFSVTDFDNFIEKDVEHPPRFVWTVDTVEKKRGNIHTNVFLCLSFSFSFSASLSFFLNRFQFKTRVLIYQRWCKVSGNPQLYIFQSCIKFLRRCQLETIEENRDHLTAANENLLGWELASNLSPVGNSLSVTIFRLRIEMHFISDFFALMETIDVDEDLFHGAP